ncbi:phage tail protein [Collinsella bouchesdurhonensis]|uniref:phage tail protein n=1 Tax=Collinsella bouchesdurhonensis TaxID=1907654 RepID=UPI001106C844|nr:hypothetical protein [Collinsella bouchesdurhonensis]
MAEKNESYAADAQNGLDSLRGAASSATSLGDALRKINVAGFFKGALEGSEQLIQRAGEYRAAMDALAAAAQRNGASAGEMDAAYRSAVGVLGSASASADVVSAAFGLAGGNAGQATGIVQALTGVYAVLGDSLPVGELARAAEQTARTGAVTGSFADLLDGANVSAESWSAALSGNGAAQQAFNAAVAAGAGTSEAFGAALAACSSEQERAQLVTDALNGAFGEAGTQFRENNADLVAYNEAQDQLSAALAQIGETLTPVVAQIVAFAAALLEQAQPAIQFLADNLPVILPIITAIGAAFVTWQVVSTVNELTSSVGALAAALGLSPFGMVAMAVAALVAGILTLWTTNEGFRDFITECWNGIISVLGPLLEGLVTFFTTTIPGALNQMGQNFLTVCTMIGVLFQAAYDAVAAIVAGILMLFISINNGISAMLSFFAQIPGAVGGFLSSAFSAVASFAGNMASKALQAGQSFVSNITSTLSGLPGKMVAIGSNIVRGIWNGISGAADWLMNKIASFAGGLLGAAAKALGIASPSKKARDYIGRNFAKGIPIGFEMEDPMGKIRGSLQASIAALKGMDYGVPGLMLAGQGAAPAYNIYINGTSIETNAGATEAFVAFFDALDMQNRLRR